MFVSLSQLSQHHICTNSKPNRVSLSWLIHNSYQISMFQSLNDTFPEYSSTLYTINYLVCISNICIDAHILFLSPSSPPSPSYPDFGIKPYMMDQLHWTAMEWALMPGHKPLRVWIKGGGRRSSINDLLRHTGKPLQPNIDLRVWVILQPHQYLILGAPRAAGWCPTSHPDTHVDAIKLICRSYQTLKWKY